MLFVAIKRKGFSWLLWIAVAAIFSSLLCAPIRANAAQLSGSAASARENLDEEVAAVVRSTSEREVSVRRTQPRELPAVRSSRPQEFGQSPKVRPRPVRGPTCPIPIRLRRLLN
ncbi:MAG TPA: hypothetical protein VFQ61_36625 [Polyangiaceae bacterium]|nr:hypothetical protein [Polyangiaceae bacterium]